MGNPDDKFTVRILWTLGPRVEPIVSVSLPDDMCERERATMIQAIAEMVGEHRDYKATAYAGRTCVDHVQITGTKVHSQSLKMRKSGTPPPPPIVKWLIKELPQGGFLPPAPRLRFEVRWMKPNTRDTIIDKTICGGK